jgi:hypothetical protein
MERRKGRIIKPWTADEIQLVADEYGRGASMRFIADQLPGRTVMSVQKLTMRTRRNDVSLGRGRKPLFWTAEEKKKLLQLKQAGAGAEDVTSHFPNRSFNSIKSALRRPSSDSFWSTEVRKSVGWTAEEVKILAEEALKGTSVEEMAKLLSRRTGSILARLHRLDIRLPLKWTPEDDKILLRMLKEGHKARNIALTLGKNRESVAHRLFIIRPRNSLPSDGRCKSTRKVSRAFTPSSAEMQEVERLRQQGSTWPAISASLFPDRPVYKVRETFQRAFKHQPERLAKVLKPAMPQSFCRAEIQDIKDLLKDNRTWDEIATLKYPSQDAMILKRTYIQQTTKRGASRVPSPDLPELQRLRNAKYTWKEIAALKYPGTTVPRVRYAFFRQTGSGEKTGKPKVEVDLAAVKRLRNNKHSWSLIRDLMYPNQSVYHVRKAFERQMTETQGVSKTTKQQLLEQRTRRAFRIPATDMPDIERLRKEGKTWRLITDMKYPDQDNWLVRRRFRDFELKGRQGKHGRFENPFELSPTDIQKIELLRKTHTWRAIANMNYPGIRSQMVRARFVEQMELRSEDLDTNATEANIQQTGQLSNINLAKTPRLQAAHNTGQPIRDAIDDTQAFRPTTANRAQPRWAADEIRIIMDGYDKGTGLRAISDKVPGRTLQAVSTIMARYKRKDPALLEIIERRPWTDQEMTTLLQVKTADVSWEDVYHLFPNRSHSSIRAVHHRISSDGNQIPKRQRGRGKRYTAEETDVLIREATKGTPVKDIALALNRTTSSLRSQLGLLKIKLPRDWTPEKDKALLRMLEEKHSFDHIAKQIGRTAASVKARWRRIRPENSLPSPEGTQYHSRSFQPSSTEIKHVERLRLEGYPWRQIAASLFPNLKQQHVRLTFVRAFQRMSLPIPTSQRRAGAFRPSSADMQDVERLRLEGHTWKQITASRFPTTTLQHVRLVFMQLFGRKLNRARKLNKAADAHPHTSAQPTDGNSKPVRVAFKFPSADVAKLRSLREANTPWKEITALMYPGVDPLKVCRAYTRRRKRMDGLTDSKASFEISSADIADIQRLRSEEKTWQQIQEMKYPQGPTWQYVRKIFLRQRLTESPSEDHSARIHISPAMLDHIQRLRAAKTTWAEITALYFPDRKQQTARTSILRRLERLHGTTNKHTGTGRRGPQAFTIPPADFDEIQRLRQANTSWKEIARLKYPDQKRWTVHRAFQRHEEKLGVRRALLRDEDTPRNVPGRRQAVQIAPAAMQEIKRLLALKMPWREIATLLYPEHNWQNVRVAFLRDEGNHPKHYQALELRRKDIATVRRLRRLKMTWYDVTALLYPDQKWFNVRRAFLRRTGDKVTGEGEPAVSVEEEEEMAETES